MHISLQILYSLCIANYANILHVFQDVKVTERPRRPIDDLIEYFNGNDGGNVPYFLPYCRKIISCTNHSLYSINFIFYSIIYHVVMSLESLISLTHNPLFCF